MSNIDHCLERLALLDRADRLLNEVRVYGHHGSMRETLAQHRLLLGEARRHLDSARSVGRSG
ncbi:hypothetical protein [Azospirillum agricola]|uniref:hypothetical protein n=1 Tax=Azospirillum agricola TaxID=1720247 RepID=UPI000A0EF77E|nr:hypothetical protein [Azospirillum agricola]MBP2233343.1 hypothetical protein [Azospirillum agricola]SMH57570.1 hypothetical protein SAMN02982994_4326 [Azospirillum lipoferum]